MTPSHPTSDNTHQHTLHQHAGTKPNTHPPPTKITSITTEYTTTQIQGGTYTTFRNYTTKPKHHSHHPLRKSQTSCPGTPQPCTEQPNVQQSDHTNASSLHPPITPETAHTRTPTGYMCTTSPYCGALQQTDTPPPHRKPPPRPPPHRN